MQTARQADDPGQTWCILGLGNPGTRYATTRHNLGFLVVDALAERSGRSFPREPQAGEPLLEVASKLRQSSTIFAKPWTFMNRSGVAARAIAERGIAPERILVIYDDIDLDLGQLRLRPHGGAGGHNGIRSILEWLDTDRFPRLRLGIRGARRTNTNDGAGSLADYVLEPFDSDELATVARFVELAADAAQSVVLDGLQNAMNRWNGKSARDADKSDKSKLGGSSEPSGTETEPDIRSNGNHGISG